MSGLEAVVVRLASTVVSTVAKSVLAPKPGAGLVADPVRPLPKPAGPEKLARVLGERIASAYASVPEHERLAAVAAVQDTFAATGALDAERLFAADLDPGRLADELRRPVTEDLAERARDLYGELLRLCCAHLVEQLTAHPTFTARAAVEHTRRTGALLREQTVSGPARETALAFEQRYADFVAGTHSRLELFGVTLGARRRAEWPLDTAYISLAVNNGHTYEPHREGLDVSGTTRTPMKVEQAFGSCDRLVLRGPAGSGKSTLVQWLALNTARQSFGPELVDFNRCVPFVLRLRSFNTPAAAAADPSVSGVVMFEHHPTEDPLPDKPSQLGDRKEVALIEQWLADFRADSHKSAAFVGGHVGAFSATWIDGVPYLVNGNSGKNPASTPVNGGFTGWTMLGIDPADGRITDPFDVPSDDSETWLRAEVHARADAVNLSAPHTLTVGDRAEASATLTQDGTRTVPVAWPVSANWSGTRVDVADSDREPGHRYGGGAPVVSYDPATGRLTALRAGTAVLRVTVNGVSADRPITVHRR
ncbi:NACHT N-terminal Helical domain 1-containing protein [Streptomyces sp. NPDC005055]